MIQAKRAPEPAIPRPPCTTRGRFCTSRQDVLYNSLDLYKSPRAICTTRFVLYNSLRGGEAICTTRSPRKRLLGSDGPVLPESSSGLRLALFMTPIKLTPLRRRSVAYVWRLCRARHKRHSFITNVSRTGAHFKTSQDLARHSTPSLTARYTHSVEDDQVEAVRALPKLSSQPFDVDGKNSALYSSDWGASEDQTVQFSAVGGSDDPRHDNHHNSNSGNALAIAATTCENTSSRRRDAGVAERGGFESHGIPRLTPAPNS